jgi:alpha-1,2-mannosyltransferase
MTRHFWLRYGPWLALLIAAVAYYPRFDKLGGISLYSQAASCLWHQQPLQQCVLLFTYPPAFAFVMVPFIALSATAQTVVWYIISLACGVLSCVLSEKIALRLFPGPWSTRDITWLRVLGVLLSLKFILAVYENQAYDLLVFPFILLGTLALMDRREIAGGASLAIAAAMKVTPLIFLPYLIVRKRFLAAGIFVVVLIAASFMQDAFLTPQGTPHGYFVTWINDIALAGVLEKGATSPLPFWDGASIYNLSLRGTLARAVYQTDYQAYFLQILRGTQIVFIGLIGILILFSLRSKALVPVDVCLLIIAMLMLSPMSSRTHFVNLTLPYFLLVAAWMKDRHTKWLGGAVLLLSFAGCTGIPRDLVPKGFTEFMRDHNDILLGTLVLIVYLAVIIFRPWQWGVGQDVSSRDHQIPAKNAVSRT